MAEQTPRETPIEDLSDRQLLVRVVKIAEHLDIMAHETHGWSRDIHGWAGKAAPLLERFGAGRAIFTRKGPNRT